MNINNTTNTTNITKNTTNTTNSINSTLTPKQLIPTILNITSGFAQFI
jgi:regulatory protein YycH of two-component signal transduction system YycFG